MIKITDLEKDFCINDVNSFCMDGKTLIVNMHEGSKYFFVNHDQVTHAFFSLKGEQPSMDMFIGRIFSSHIEHLKYLLMERFKDD